MSAFVNYRRHRSDVRLDRLDRLRHHLPLKAQNATRRHGEEPYRDQPRNIPAARQTTESRRPAGPIQSSPAWVSIVTMSHLAPAVSTDTTAPRGAQSAPSWPRRERRPATSRTGPGRCGPRPLDGRHPALAPRWSGPRRGRCRRRATAWREEVIDPVLDGVAVRSPHLPSALEQGLDDAAEHVGLFGGRGEGLDAEAEQRRVLGGDRGGERDQLGRDDEVAVDSREGCRAGGPRRPRRRRRPRTRRRSTVVPPTVSRVSSTNTPIPPATPTSTASVT